MKTPTPDFYAGAILNPLNDLKCEWIPNGILVVEKATGRLIDYGPEARILKRFGKDMDPRKVRRFPNSILMPAFYDLHFHWVQDEVREMPKDSLLEWLEKYTFPTEAKFEKKAYSNQNAKQFFKRLSRAGTIGGAIYSSIHEAAIDAAMKEVKGRFVVGNVLMNMNSPAALTQTESESLALTRKLIKRYGKRHAFTPRFAITTTPKVMLEGAKMADRAGCFKQTHLSETKPEIDFVLSIFKALPGFKKVKTYTDIYQQTGMLGPRSLMGHGIHLSQAELSTLSRTKTSIVHCPTSNAPIETRGLGSGLFDFKKTEKANVRWALGSDIGGGPFLSMFDVMNSFVEQNLEKKVKGATFIKALYRSTLAGAEILGLGKLSGNFKKGKSADFLVVSSKVASHASSAESALEMMISPLSGNREKYDVLPDAVYFEGRKLFSL
jgi:guanine deaminase